MSTKLDDLETFARSVATLRSAEIDVDVAALADLYDVAWPGDDEDDEHEPTREELLEAQKRREARAPGGST